MRLPFLLQQHKKICVYRYACVFLCRHVGMGGERDIHAYIYIDV